MSEQVLVGEAAKRLGVSTGWIRRLELDGEIPPARRLSRLRIYTPTEIEYLRHLLEQRRATHRKSRVATSAAD